MAEIVIAVYEKGILRPLSPLGLRERQTVRIQVMPDKVIPAEETCATSEIDQADDIIQIMVAAGLMRPPERKLPRPPDPVSEQERRRLADALAQAPGKPLSEVIIEERGER